MLAKMSAGIKGLKDAPERLRMSHELFKSMGGEVKAVYMVEVMDSWDIVAVAEAPDDQTMAKLAMKVGAKGLITTETMRAFTEDELNHLVSALP